MEIDSRPSNLFRQYNEFYSKSTDFEFDTTDYPSDAIGFRVAGFAEP